MNFEFSFFVSDEFLSLSQIYLSRRNMLALPVADNRLARNQILDGVVVRHFRTGENNSYEDLFEVGLLVAGFSSKGHLDARA